MPYRVIRRTQRIYFLVLCAIATLVVSSFTYAVYRQAVRTAAYEQWVVHSYEVLHRSRSLMIALLDIESNQRGYFLTRAERYLLLVEKARRRMVEDMDSLRVMTRDNAQQQAVVEDIQARFEAFRQLSDAQTERYRRRGPRSLSLERFEESRRLLTAVRGTLENFIAGELQILSERTARTHQEHEEYLRRLLVGAGLALVGLFIGNALIVSLMGRSRRAEAALRHIEETYGLVLQGTDDGVFDFDPNSGKVSYSGGYRRQLGYEESEPMDDVESGFNRFLHPDDHGRVWAEIERFSRREIPAYAIVFRLRHRDGRWRWILSRAVGVWDAGGNIRRIVGVHTDITEQKQREEELRQLNSELESFTYIASHDLRSPLVNIKGFAREIEHAVERVKAGCGAQDGCASMDAQAALQSDIPEALGFIGSAVERMDALTNSILRLSQIGRREYHFSEVNMEQVMRRCLDALAYEIGQKGVRIAVEALPECYTDAGAIEQIVGNLLDNAVKYLDPARPGIIRISGSVAQGEAIYRVEDNGRGIPQAEYNKVFDIFRRASNSGEVRGSGMGMAFVRATMRKLGGRIWFNSALGEGTVFHIALPGSARKGGV